MKKLLNDPSDYVDESLAGLELAHPDIYRRAASSPRVVTRAKPIRPGKVGLVSGGGSGHLPTFTGFVGQGLLDACSIGNVFAGPSVDDCVEAMREANGGAGVLRLYGNYGGDRMNFDMAGEMLEMEGIETTTVLTADDIASAGPDERRKRRGVAGLILAYKTTGAKAEQDGATLAEVTEVARKTTEATATIGVGLTSCIVPEAGKPTFTIGADEIEMGIGIHGEPGIWRGPLRPADALAGEMVERLLADTAMGGGERVAVLVNSLGATPLEELYILHRVVASELKAKGITIGFVRIGRYATSMEMAGASISFLRLDGELEGLLRAPATCPFWSNEP
jgi:dihydroxyacetone kinase-like protein